jgi:uncharacterized protein (TIGR00106 family)
MKNQTKENENTDVLIEFSMSPLDKGISVSRYVAPIIDVIDRSGLAYRMGPLGTCVEGSFEECMAVVQQCFETMRAECNRITMTLKMDYRVGSGGRLRSKIQAVEKKLGREVKK